MNQLLGIRKQVIDKTIIGFDNLFIATIQKETDRQARLLVSQSQIIQAVRNERRSVCPDG